jgi:NADPH:quinone reductase-like Zn-dependent oxidoreductase
MTYAIRLKQSGGPQVLQLEQFEQSAPGPGQAWVDQHAIGVNYLDVTQRNGAVPIPLPNGLGLEAAGIVAAVGPTSRMLWSVIGSLMPLAPWVATRRGGCTPQIVW